MNQRMVIKLDDKDKCYLIHANGECYYLHHLVNNYDSLFIEVKRKKAHEKTNKTNR